MVDGTVDGSPGPRRARHATWPTTSALGGFTPLLYAPSGCSMQLLAHTPIPHRSLSRLVCLCGRPVPPAECECTTLVTSTLRKLCGSARRSKARCRDVTTRAHVAVVRSSSGAVCCQLSREQQRVLSLLLNGVGKLRNIWSCDLLLRVPHAVCLHP